MKEAEGKAAATIQASKDLNPEEVAEMLLRQAELQNEEMDVSPPSPPPPPPAAPQINCLSFARRTPG
jgi:hypothetical protein